MHQGLGFEKWRKCAEREFKESLKCQDGPGLGAVRGVSADRRVEHKVVEGFGTIDGESILAALLDLGGFGDIFRRPASRTASTRPTHSKIQDHTNMQHQYGKPPPPSPPSPPANP